MSEFIRVDGRKKDELRPIDIQIGVLDSADGSALIRMGKNIILAAVRGPRELHPKHLAMPDRAKIRCTYRMATFSVPDRKSPAPSRREKEISKVLTEALESVVLSHLYPRSAIDIFIQVIQADGGTRCASATAASLALADAGIPMRDLIAGVAAGIFKDEVVLDLCDEEDKDGTGDLPIVYSPSTDEISLLQLDGQFTLDQFEEALNLAIDGARKIYDMEKQALIDRYKIDVEEEIHEEVHVEEQVIEGVIEEELEEPVAEEEFVEETIQPISKGEIAEEGEEVSETTLIEESEATAEEVAEPPMPPSEEAEVAVGGSSESTEISEASETIAYQSAMSLEQETETSEESIQEKTEEEMAGEESFPEEAQEQETEESIEEDVISVEEYEDEEEKFDEWEDLGEDEVPSTEPETEEEELEDEEFEDTDTLEITELEDQEEI